MQSWESTDTPSSKQPGVFVVDQYQPKKSTDVDQPRNLAKSVTVE